MPTGGYDNGIFIGYSISRYVDLKTENKKTPQNTDTDKQAIFSSNRWQKLLYERVIKPYRKKHRLATIGLRIKSSANQKDPVVVFKQYRLGFLILGEETSLIEIQYPYEPSNVVVLKPKYDELGEKIKDYIQKLREADFFGRALGGGGFNLT